jgi:hypothetical protein
MEGCSSREGRARISLSAVLATAAGLSRR